MSYQRDDLSAVERVRDALRDRGKHVWLDVDYGNIPLGTEWEVRIQKEIEACSAFIFVISPRSTGSSACMSELAAAVELQKLLIPIVHDHAQPSELPEILARTQWIDLYAGEDWEGGIEPACRCARERRRVARPAHALCRSRTRMA